MLTWARIISEEARARSTRAFQQPHGSALMHSAALTALEIVWVAHAQIKAFSGRDQCVNSNPWIMNAVPTSTGCAYGDNLLELLMSGTASFEGASSCIGCWTHVATAIDYDGCRDSQPRTAIELLVKKQPQF